VKIGIGGAAYFTTQPHITLAMETLNSIRSAEHDLEYVFFLNSPTSYGVPELAEFSDVYRNDRNNVSRAWNRSIDLLLRRGCKYVIVPNLDLVVKADAVDRLVAFAEAHQEHILWTAQNWHYLRDENGIPGIANAPTPDVSTPHPHFSMFMVDHRLFEKVGPFDERFQPAYNEDLDMHWRIRLAGESAASYEGARFFHHGSQTIRNDGQLSDANFLSHAALDRYFQEKWSYKPPTADDPFTDGMFKFPFNDPDKVGAEKLLTETWSIPVGLTSE
jgi:GT2 family glycosyltransferase